MGLNRFVVASNVRGDLEWVRKAARFARRNNAPLILLGDLIGEIFEPATRIEYEHAVKKIGATSLEKSVERANFFREEAGDDARRVVKFYDTYIGMPDTRPVWGRKKDYTLQIGEAYSKVNQIAFKIEDVCEEEKAQYNIIPDCIQTRETKRMEPSGSSHEDKCGILERQVISLGDDMSIRVGGIGLSNELGIRPKSSLPAWFLTEDESVSSKHTTRIEDYLDPLHIVFLNSIPEKLRLEGKIVILPGEVPSYAIAQRQVTINECAEKLSLYDLDKEVLTRTVYNKNLKEEDCQEIDMRRFAVKPVNIENKNLGWLSYIGGGAALLTIGMLGAYVFRTSPEAEKPAAPAPAERKIDSIIIENSRKISVDFDTKENRGLAQAVIDRRADIAGKEYGPATQIYFAQGFDTDGDAKVSAEELAEYMKQREWCSNLKPAQTSGTKMIYKSPSYIYNSQSDMDKMKELIARQASLQKVENTPAWQEYIKEWVANEYNAPRNAKSVLLNNKIINTYEQQINAWEKK